MRYLFLVVLLYVSSFASAQVNSLNYLLDYNCETNLYEVKLKINEGSATSTMERIQFNSQISMVIPTGLSFKIIERFNPIQDNQTYTGTIPCNWDTFTPVESPPEQPESDFYAISPQLSPACFYNNLSTGDEVLLFACKIGEDTVYNPEIRFFNNGVDPSIQSSGSDFNNGFAIGSPIQIYSGNEYSSCVSSTNRVELNVKVFPNPFIDQILVDSEFPISAMKLSDTHGVTHYSVTKINEKRVVIPAENLPAGVYTISYESSAGSRSVKVVKM